MNSTRDEESGILLELNPSPKRDEENLSHGLLKSVWEDKNKWIIFNIKLSSVLNKYS